MVNSKPQCAWSVDERSLFFSVSAPPPPAPVHPAWLMIDLIALRVSHHKTENKKTAIKNQRTTSSSAADAASCC